MFINFAHQSYWEPAYLGHLGVAELFVHDHTLDELGILQLSSNFALYLDELEVDIFPLHVCNGQDSIDSNFCHLSVTAVNPVGSKG